VQNGNPAAVALDDKVFAICRENLLGHSSDRQNTGEAIAMNFDIRDSSVVDQDVEQSLIPIVWPEGERGVGHSDHLPQKNHGRITVRQYCSGTNPGKTGKFLEG